MAEEIIYAWPAPSSHGTTTYEVLLSSAGGLTCPCPGWINKKKGKDRTCRHVREKAAEAQRLLALFKANKPLPPRPIIVGGMISQPKAVVTGASRVIMDADDDEN